MDNVAARMLHVPRGVPIARFQPPAEVPIAPGQEVPLIAKDAPAERKLQEIWTAKTRTFDLSNDEQREAYDAVWQRITDGHATMSESRVDFHEGKYVALLRWADFSYKLPTA
jgi:hypothetical protein